MLLHIFQTPDLAHNLRHEIKDHVQAIEPENAFRLPEPRRVSINANGLLSSCPTLRKCLDECIRLYTDGTTVLQAEKTFSINTQNPHPNSANNPPIQRLVKIDAGDILILDPAAHLDRLHYHPFDPARPPSEASTLYRECMSKLEENGKGPSIQTESQILLTVAAIIALWDIEPMGGTGDGGGSGGKVPRSRWNSMVASPASDVRVAIKPRKLS